jgi:hypothetical protein
MEVTLLLFETRQRMSVVRNKLEGVRRDLDQLVNESNGSQDFGLVAGLGQASHALHRALVTIEDEMGIEPSTVGDA